MLNSGENCSEKLFFAAKFYKTHGWSVIPLLGGMNLHDLKRPAIKWGRYQHTQPEVTDFENWFLKSGFGGLGVVCGRVSQLAVLDFDDPQKASEFLRLHPHLTQTRVVESGTRHLPHYYYHIPDELAVHSRSVPGADFRADGAYVVAPPTGQGEVQWRVIDDTPPYTLSAGDLKAIWRFLVSPIPEVSQNGLETPSQSNLSQSIHPIAASLLESGAELKRRRNSDASINDLLALYRGRLDHGRNNALFQVVCIARDRGVGKSVVIEKLVAVHASQPARDGSNESFHVRYAEALCTIESVYSRPARPSVDTDLSDEYHKSQEGVGIPTPFDPNAVSGLLNSIREWLLGHAFAAAARMLDGLILAGLKVRSLFTERQACELLRHYRIGRRS
ncbi:MAG TPA: bifunctional DNA primase/polymerase, partial [Terriglobales bacterium]|nr:bifunctional DNA primase/polymerase [Terriglobales bacterium]